MEPVVFIEVSRETGMPLAKGKKKKVSEYIALTVDDAMEALRTRRYDFSFYRNKDVDTYNVYFVISDAKVPEIFVMKRYKKINTSFKMERHAFAKIREMDALCKSTLIEGKPITLTTKEIYWILMEYFDGSVVEMERELTESERRYILKTTAKAVKCLRESGLYYTDMKLDQVLYRIKDDNSIEVKLADLEVSGKGEDAIVTYRPPKGSRFLDYDGHYKYGATDEAVNWGIIVLILQLWTKDNRSLRHAFRKYYRNHRSMMSALKGKVPDDIYYLVNELYTKWDSISCDDLFKALRI